MSIELQPVETEAAIEAFLDVRARVDPVFPITRANFDDGRDRPDRLDVLAYLDGEPVGAAWANLPSTSSASEFMFVSVRVVPERRRLGAGTVLFARVSQHARSYGRSRLYTVTRDADRDTLDYLGKRGYVELSRMEQLARDLSHPLPAEPPPAGIEIVPLEPEHEQGMWEVAKEANPDVPSADPIVAGTFEAWRRRELAPLVYRELSFVALEDGVVVGWATLGEDQPGTAAGHYMTGVARRARGRGVARALKLAQMRAAREAGIRELRTQNDVANVAMRRVNERLGYRLRFAWIHLGGQLL
jgi:GNAT superfamily N-acetyltransferase